MRIVKFKLRANCDDIIRIYIFYNDAQTANDF